jgi:DNA primase
MDLETLKEEVRARADVVDIIGRVVKLQRASGAWKGLCPFHQEKTPSFHVNPRRQSYHCFGCGAGGDVFKFVMETERLDFMGALEKLAHQVGVPFELDGRRGDSTLRRRLYDLHERTASYYQAMIRDTENGSAASAYLNQRELAETTPDTYRLGYAPNGFDILLKEARSWGFEEKELEESGLFSKRDQPRNGEVLYDRFRNRLMFPILDEQARVIGFSGRVIPPDEAKAKYMNSPETMLFKKSRVLYGIERARKPMADQRRAVLCEGQLDVIRCHEAGIAEAVAAQGTAITSEHAKILKRYADEVVLLLDADTAGVKAALRSAEVLLESGLTVRVAALPEGEDPDDVVRRHGYAKLTEILAAAEPFIVFQVKNLVAREGEITETSRLRVAREVMEVIAKAPEALHREELVHQAAGALGMREEALRLDLESTRREQTTARPAVPRSKPETISQQPPSPGRRQPQQKKEDLAIPPAEALLLDLLCAYPGEVETARGYLRPEHLQHPDSRDLLDVFYGLKQPDRNGILDAIREHPAGERLAELDQRDSLNLSEEMGTPQEAMQNLIVVLRKEALIRKRTAIQARPPSENATDRGDTEMEIFTLTNWIGSLKAAAAHPGKPLEWEKAQILLNLMDEEGS